MNEEAEKYIVKSCDVDALSKAEITRCLRLIADGGAVNMTTARRHFPRSAKVAVARDDRDVVGIASIKPIREDYASGVAENAKFPFDPKTPELGYVAVDAAHRGNKLSSRMAQELSKEHGALFATTSDPKMKSALRGAGFVQRGIEWEGGHENVLSLWIKS